MSVAHNTNTWVGRIHQDSAGGASWIARREGAANVIAVTGELDAANMPQFACYARRVLAEGRPVILDLGRLDFLAAQGIQMLIELDCESRRRTAQWALLPGSAGARLLKLCDTEADQWCVTSISEALERFSPRARVSLQLVTEPC
jgi:anti-anti-sigma factor